MGVSTNTGAREEGIGRAVFEKARLAAADIAVITDARQDMVYVSQTFTAMTGYTPEDVLGRNCRLLQGPGSNPDTVDEIRQVLAAGGTFDGELLNYRRDGSAFWNALKVIPLRQGDGTITHYVSVQRDISNRIALLEQLRYQALHDQMTGLPNRVAGERAVEEAVTRSAAPHQAVGVGLIDLDDFRIVNNEFGHAAGDAVLRQWASRLQSRLPDSDLLARMGGDEFLLILNNIHREQALSDVAGVLYHLHRAVEEPFTIDGQDIQLDMSMGIALVPQDGTDSRTILRHADEALYTVKALGRHRTLWWQPAADITTSTSSPTTPALNHTIEFATDDFTGPTADNESTVDKRTRATSRRRPALQASNHFREAVYRGDVVIELQPVIDLRNGSVHLFEALARLRLPGRAVAYPVEFLPHLHDDDQQALFGSVLTHALDFVVMAETAGKSYDVSVNLPPTLLGYPLTLLTVRQALMRRGLHPSRLGLELLESDILGSETQRAALQDLVDFGVGLAMDDLGAGYSNLQRLSSFPFSALKLDRGLLTNTYQKPLETLSMIATLVQMGRDLSMNVVVEGLEDEKLTEAAVIFGAPLGQGYHLARPLPVLEALTWEESFSFTLHQSAIQTSLGALAYHWQFARLGTAHPLPLTDCPLTRFIADQNYPQDIGAWHERQHNPQGMHAASSRFLIDWLVDHVRAASKTCNTTRH